MRILHYIPSIDETSGGVGAYMQLLTRDLSALCELHVVTHRSENERKLEGCIVHYIANKWLPWNSCKAEFVQLLKMVKPDVVHVLMNGRIVRTDGPQLALEIEKRGFDWIREEL